LGGGFSYGQNPKYSAPSLALLIAFVLLATSEVSAASSDRNPPRATLMKYKTSLQPSYVGGGQWYYPDGGYVIFDSFGVFYFPKADEVAQGRRLHVRFDKPERPNFFEVNAFPKANYDKGFGGYRTAGNKRELKSYLKPVKRDGQTVAWEVFFRVGQSDRHYYLKTAVGWEKKRGTAYGRLVYTSHVRTR